MSKIQIILNGHVDRETIAAALIDDSSYVVEVVDNYSDTPTTYNLDIYDLDSTNKEAFYKTLDNASNLIEDTGFVWKVVRTGKSFKTEDSFVRDAVSTELPLTELDDGTPLKLIFETPGFLVNTATEIDLWYNQDFNPTDLAALADVGIVLSGDGKAFSFTNTTDCKVYFRKPSGATEIYIIDYDGSNDIIAV